MKKFVKPLIIVSSIAAVVGIGAVSYAVWRAGVSDPVKIDGNSASISAAYSFADGSDSKTITVPTVIPYDHDGKNSYAVVVDLPTITATENFSITVTYSEGKTISGDLYFAVGDQSSSAPKETVSWGDYDAWHIVGDSAETASSANVETTSIPTQLTFLLDTHSAADMGKSFTLTVSLGAPVT